MTLRLGVDFGTSNTAAAFWDGDRVRPILLDGVSATCPTAIFLDYGARAMVFGNAAVDALTEGREGRFMRALKRVLGTPLMREPRQLLNRRMTLIDLLADFLGQLRAAAEAQTGTPVTAVLSGRPVHFHDADPERDARAEADLAECYRRAGFAEVEFLFEPVAAAMADGGDPGPDGLGLVVDIGGGTSDFSLYRQTDDGLRILASHGERIGGTDFDRAISISRVMPLFGLGHPIRAEFGTATHPAPVALFHDLATWEKIAFLYTADSRRAAADMARYAVEPAVFARLCTILELELGHDVAFAVERAKIAARGQAGRIGLDVVERGLAVAMSREGMKRDLAPFATAIAAAAVDTVSSAGFGPDDVDRIVFVGGSSLLPDVQAAVAARFPGTELAQGSAFSAVVDGLAIAAAHGS